MRTIISVLLLGTALAAGGTATYEAYNPQGAAWFNEGKLAPQIEQAEIRSGQDQTGEGIIRQPTNQGNMDAPKYQNNVYADFRATGPPQMDNYPKSPEEAARQETSYSNKDAGNLANFGIYRDWGK